MAAFRFREQRTRRRWYSGTLLAVALFLAVFFVAGAGATLPGSPSDFESHDGDMIAQTGHDWANVSYSEKEDAYSTNSDDSFEPGQKQDTACPAITGHSNPPKDDFMDAAAYSETATSDTYSGHTYLYGATIRYAENGNASENVELNQGTGGKCDSGLYERVAGDKLIAIDYLNGGTNAEFHVLTWVTSGACYVSNHEAPCWGADVEEITGVDAAEGEVNQDPIAAGDNPLTDVALAAGQFAEFGINLTDAGIIAANVCTGFAGATFESRSSGSSFVSSTKDVVAVEHPISNCGQIIISKETSPSSDPLDTSFTFDASGGLDPASFTLKGGESQDYGNEVYAGTYGVGETPDSNYTLSNIDCSSGSTVTNGSTVTIGASDGFETGDTSVSIDLKPGDVVECIFTNTLKTGAIKVHKVDAKTGDGLGGAFFTYRGADNVVHDFPSRTDGNGYACVDGLLFGTYAVAEKTAPTGYAKDADSQRVTVNAIGTCTRGTQTAPAHAYADTPLSTIEVEFSSQSGTTSATITCTDENGNTLPADRGSIRGEDQIYSGLEPNSDAEHNYTCTINIDP